MEIKFKQWDCILEFLKYSNGRTALQLTDKHTGEPVAVCTSNLPNENLKTDQVVIKDYSENSGMLETLFAAGVVGPALRYTQSGFVRMPICKLLIKPPDK